MLVHARRNLSISAAVLALSGSLALSQATPAPPAASDSPTPASAPRGPRPPMRPQMGRDEMHGPRDMRGFHGPDMRFHDGGDRHMDMGGFHMGPGGMWWKNPRIVERLSLSADQTKKMDGIVEQSRLQLIDLRANLEKQQVMLGPILDANPLDAARASAQIDKVANARADLEKANAKMLLNIRGVLTPDQWTKLHERHMGTPGTPAAPTAPGAATDGPGGSRWHGRTGGPRGDGMDPVSPPIDPQ